MRAKGGWRLLGGLLAIGLAGCVHDRQRLHDQLKELKDRLAQVEEARKRESERSEELENRVLILRDKLETAQLAAQRTRLRPKLPVLRIGAGGRPAASPPASSGASSSASSSGATADGGAGEPEEIVEPAIPAAVSGLTEREAAKRGGARPVLRVVGRARGRPRVAGRRGRARLSAGPATGAARSLDPELAQVNERLPIVPLPDELDAATGAGPGAASAPAEPGRLRGPRPDPGPVRAYRAALAAMRAQRYDAALSQLAAFVRRYPRHDYADNALYWRGECYYAKKDFPRAIRQFERVIREYPHANKAPDALLKLGYAYVSTGDLKAARAVLKQVVAIYPRNRVAALARAKLDSIALVAAPKKAVAP